MARITSLQDLEIWKLAVALSENIGVILNRPGFEQEPGLKNQLLNSSCFVMDTIAEGFERRSKHAFAGLLSAATGSLEEIRLQLYRCLDKKLIDTDTFEKLLVESDVLVNRTAVLISYLNKAAVKDVTFNRDR